MISPQNYNQIHQWMVNNANPVIFEIQETIQNIADELGVLIPSSGSCPKHLAEVLDEIKLIEDNLVIISSNLFSKKTLESIIIDTEIPKVDDVQHQLFSSYLPPINVSVNNIEKLVNRMNKQIRKYEKDETEEEEEIEQQVRFIEKLDKIKGGIHSFGKELIMYNIQSREEYYNQPSWSERPIGTFHLEILENQTNTVRNRVLITSKGFISFGKLLSNDIIIKHPSCHNQHAVIQFRPCDAFDEIYIYDLSQNTFVNDEPVQTRCFYPLFPGDSIRFGDFPYSFILRDTAISGSRISTIPFDCSLFARLSQSFVASDLLNSIKQASSESMEEAKEELAIVLNKQAEQDSAAEKVVEILPPVPKVQLPPLDPLSKDFDKEEYKRKMIAAYELQKLENEKILHSIKERESQGLPPIIYIPFVPERKAKSPKKRWWQLL